MSALAAFLLLALLSEIAGTVGGFGSSVFFVPIATLFYDFQTVLMLTAILHNFSNVTKVVMFRRHIDFRLLLLFGVPSTLFVLAGAWLSRYVNVRYSELLLGLFLAVFSAWIFFRPSFRLAPTTTGSIGSGATAGFLAGLIGTGGAIRGMSLASFALEKSSFIATSASIDFFVDLSRTGIYYRNGYWKGLPLETIPWLLGVAIVGTWIGKKILDRIPQEIFRRIVLALLFITGLWMLGKAAGTWSA